MKQTPKEKDRKLFEDVNKYLYDNPKRTKVTMAWVSANCFSKIIVKYIKLKQKLRGLK